jgi:hypothetical protein
MTAKLFDMARTFVIGVPGTGPITVGTAVPDYQTFAAAGAQDGDTLTYRIADGNAWEVGTGTYVAAGPTITRGPLFSSAPGNVAIQCTGLAQIFSTALASSFGAGGGSGTVDVVKDPLTTVTNPSVIYFTSGATVTNLCCGAAGVAVTGGGTGPQGPQGPQGVQGVQGAVGAQGTIGPQGAVGAQGSTGAQGAQGSNTLTFYGGGGTITNAATLGVIGGTISSGGAGVALLTVSGGGGGGSYVGDIGIDVTSGSPGTIKNTGTIAQPAATSGNGIGIKFESGVPGAGGIRSGGVYMYTANVTAAGTGTPIGSGPAQFYTGNVYVTDPTGSGNAGQTGFFAGNAGNSTIAAHGALAAQSGGSLRGGTQAGGGAVNFSGGAAYSAPTANYGGGVGFYGGNALGGETAVGGGIVLQPGAASGGSTSNINGGLYINNLGTTDPHVLNQAWLGVDNGITLSSG